MVHEPLPVGQEAFIHGAPTSSKLLVLPRLARATVKIDLEERGVIIHYHNTDTQVDPV